MEVTGKVLREVEFRDRLRGYDTDEVDEFLEKVAVGVDALNARIEELETRLASQPKPAEPAIAPAPAMPSMDDDAIRRTLVLAQRTADLAVGEAREEAARLVEEAKTEAETLVARAEEAARRLRAEAEEEMQARVARLGEERERLDREVRSLTRMVEGERERLTESLSAALRYVRETLAVGDEAAARASAEGETTPPRDGPSGAGEPLSRRSARAGEPPGGDRPAASDDGTSPPTTAVPASPPPPPPKAAIQPELPDVEAEIHEDAATAAWSPKAEPGAGHVGRPRPMTAAEPAEPAEPAGEGEAEEALWERWAAGRDLGVVPGPADFSRRPSGTRAEHDRGWSA
jgi:DivIVA domain-containing protein